MTNPTATTTEAIKGNFLCRWITSIKCGIPARYVIGLLGFFGFVLNYMLRINMSIAIVAMVRNNQSRRATLGPSDNYTLFEDEEARRNEEGEFSWNESTQALITGAFFWGYLFLQIPGGRFAEMFGAKYIFGLSIFLSGVVTLLVPWAAEENPTKLICLRVLLGLFEGATYPSMHAMLSKWTPPLERSRMATLVYSGSQAGTVIALPLGGFIISALGWRFVFYIMGGLPVIWAALWLYFAYDSPQTHPRISAEELKYLEESLQSSTTASGSKSLAVPWKKILTSVPFLALIVANLSGAWGFWTLLILLPTYMKNILHFDIKSNSMLSAIPYVTMWIFGIAYGIFADHLRSSGKVTTGNVRKLSCSIALILPAVLLFILTFVGNHAVPTVVIFTLAVGLHGAKYSAFLSNHLDIAPNFAGTLLGLANSAATLPGWLAPITAGALTNGQQTIEQWHKVFYISSAIYLVGCTVFVLFASGEEQPWNQAPKPKPIKPETKKATTSFSEEEKTKA